MYIYIWNEYIIYNIMCIHIYFKWTYKIKYTCLFSIEIVKTKLYKGLIKYEKYKHLIEKGTGKETL